MKKLKVWRDLLILFLVCLAIFVPLIHFGLKYDEETTGGSAAPKATKAQKYFKRKDFVYQGQKFSLSNILDVDDSDGVTALTSSHKTPQIFQINGFPTSKIIGVSFFYDDGSGEMSAGWMFRPYLHQSSPSPETVASDFALIEPEKVVKLVRMFKETKSGYQSKTTHFSADECRELVEQVHGIIEKSQPLRLSSKKIDSGSETCALVFQSRFNKNVTLPLFIRRKHLYYGYSGDYHGWKISGKLLNLVKKPDAHDKITFS